MNTDRIVIAQRTAAALFAIGILFVVAAIFWPASGDALLSAGGIAAAAFGFPAGIAFVVAYWLEAHATEDPDHREGDEN